MEAVSKSKNVSPRKGIQRQPQATWPVNKKRSVLAFLQQKRVNLFSEFLLPHGKPTNAKQSEKSSIVNSGRRAAQKTCAIRVTGRKKRRKSRNAPHVRRSVKADATV